MTDRELVLDVANAMECAEQFSSANELFVTLVHAPTGEWSVEFERGLDVISQRFAKDVVGLPRAIREAIVEAKSTIGIE